MLDHLWVPKATLGWPRCPEKHMAWLEKGPASNFHPQLGRLLLRGDNTPPAETPGYKPSSSHRSLSWFVLGTWQVDPKFLLKGIHRKGSWSESATLPQHLSTYLPELRGDTPWAARLGVGVGGEQAKLLCSERRWQMSAEDAAYMVTALFSIKR